MTLKLSKLDKISKQYSLKSPFCIEGVLMAKFRVEIDYSVCQGFGACVELCSDLVLSDETGKSHMGGARKDEKGETKELTDIGCYEKAAKACPFKAIHITNLETNENLV
jgi:ferredoxin